MARYEHLPIYKAALDVAVGFEKLVAGFSRYHKYTLCSELRNGSRRVLEQVVRANAARERLPELLVLRERLDSLLLTMPLLREVRAFRVFPSHCSGWRGASRPGQRRIFWCSLRPGSTSLPASPPGTA